MPGSALVEVLRFRKRRVPFTRQQNTREPLYLAHHFRDVHLQVGSFVHTEYQGLSPDVVN